MWAPQNSKKLCCHHEKSDMCDRDSCVSGRVTVPLDSQPMNYEPDPPADCFWTKQVFSKSVTSSSSSGTMLICLRLHHLTCCCLITDTQRWQSEDQLAATSLISSLLVRKRSAVTVRLLWLCVCGNPQLITLSSRDIISIKQPSGSTQSVGPSVGTKRSFLSAHCPNCIYFSQRVKWEDCDHCHLNFKGHIDHILM